MPERGALQGNVGELERQEIVRSASWRSVPRSGATDARALATNPVVIIVTHESHQSVDALMINAERRTWSPTVSNFRPCCPTSSTRPEAGRNESRREFGALRTGEECPRALEIVRMDEDLAPAGGGEVLERRVDRCRVPVAALDACVAEQSADQFGLRLARDDGDDGNVFFSGHEPEDTSADHLPQCALHDAEIESRVRTSNV
jgi:hypothetical protein